MSQDQGVDAKSSSRWWIWLIVGAGVIVVAGAAGIYFFLLGSKSPEKLELGQSGKPNPATTITPTGSWSVAGGSEAGYRVREKLARLSAQSDAVGRTSDVTGGLEIVGNGGQMTAQNVNVSVNVSTLKSDEDRRDGRIKTQGLESNKFPTATFKSTAPIPIPPAALNGDQVEVTANGDLTIHGVTKQVSIPMQVQQSGDEIEVVGSITFPFSDFGMQPPTISGIVTVGETASMEFRLFFEKSGG